MIRRSKEEKRRSRIVYARLDADKTAQPRTRLVGHTKQDGTCVGPGSVKPDALEDVQTKKRIPLTA
jgi:hypothetical protein